ncbi:uncharacterized protein LOC144115007 [Amblyomma americanum]
MCDASSRDGAESKRLEMKPVCMAPRRGGGTVFKATDAVARAGGSVEVDSAASATMSKTFHRRSTAACGLVVLMLLLCSVGLLIAFLKGHQQQTRDSHTLHGMTPRRGTKNDNFPNRRTTQPPSTTTTRRPLQTTTLEPPKPKLDFRLPATMVPLAYDLTLEPHLSRDSFDGEVWITVNATRPVDRFVVHVFRLTVDETEVFFEDGSPLSTGAPFEDDLNEFFVVPVADKAGAGPTPAGLYRLRFKFRGSLVGGIVGFYKSSYKIDNETRYLATSKFQPTYARRAFPCFDEPNFKSRFNVTIIHDNNHMALSNMPVLSGYPVMREDGKMVTKFEESVPMVTYLVCFIVCDFERMQTVASVDNIPFSVYAAPNQLNKTHYALDIGSRILSFYEKYFGLKYPLPKQDMIAIPDFVSGAMEHWGLITYREVNLLYDTKKSSPRNKQRVAAVIAHELAHQWFGNLVTMKWWDDLWLNEGFASYIEYKGIDHVEPEWDMMNQFLTEDLQPVMDLDSTTTSHPVVQSVSHPDEITEIFDTISYNKGASVLRMLENFLGPSVFQRGVSSFLRNHQFGNAKTEELWAELSEAAGYTLPAGYNVSSIMDTWTRQMGYPVVTISRSPDDPTLIRVVQERFLRNNQHQRNGSDASPFGYKWSIPLSYKTSAAKNKVKQIWLHNEQDEFHIYDAGQHGWVKFNVNQTGYYLVNYDPTDWQRLGEVLQKHHEELTPADRSNLLYDAFQLAWSNRLSYDVLFNMTQYLIHEMHLIPWSTAHGSLLALTHLLENTEVRRPMQTYIRKLVDPIYKTLGWEDGDKHMNNMLRRVILDLACRNLHQECLKEAKRRLSAWVDGGQDVPRNIRGVVYRYGIYQSSGDHEWQFMWEKYLKEVSAQERINLLYGLAHVRSPPLIHRYLAYAMNESYVRRQDFFSVLSFLAGNPVGRDIVWKFVRYKWDRLVHRFSLNDRNFGNVVKTICDYFTKQFDYNEMQAFFHKNPNAGAGRRAREQALENVRNNIAWIKHHEPSVARWLTTNVIPEPWENMRLPRHVIPASYDITLEPMPVENITVGSSTIRITVVKATSVLLVHAKNINITRTTVIRHKRDTFEEVPLGDEPFLYVENDYWVIQTRDVLPPGGYVLKFDFSSSMRNYLSGIYKSSYWDEASKSNKYMVTSQFQPTFARMAFPCFDEPGFKANFTITVIHDAEMKAISNMPVDKIRNLDDTRVSTKFQESHKMTTYLVAISVCDFNYISGNTSSGTPVRIFARQEMLPHAHYALSATIQVLELFENQFAIRFPLPKLDSIAIPDPQAAAMENWGLIMYSECMMLYNQNMTSVSDHYSTVEVISHELAHMWFGNLVTMKWWDDLWLNEGFATYSSHKGIELVEPTWDAETQFLLKLISGVLEKDAVLSSHPIVMPVIQTSDIAEIFDIISYSKGSAVIRMLESFMGSGDFIRGLQNYLKNRKRSSAVTLDLWKALESVSSKHQHITTIMNTWTRQMGYPCVSVRRLHSNGSQYEIVQQRFLLNPDDAANLTNDSPFRYTWEIPFSYKTSEENEGLHWLRTKKAEVINLPTSDGNTWVKFNNEFKGYYLVKYDENELKTFSQLLLENQTVLSASDRAEILLETFLLARAGMTPYAAAMDLTKYLRHERHFIPLMVASRAFQHIAMCLKDHPEKNLFLDYVKYITEEAFEELRWRDRGDHLTKRAREVVLYLSCFSGDRVCLQNAADLLEAWFAGAMIPPNLRELVYVWGMAASGNVTIWEAMYSRYKKELLPAERKSLIKGLASIDNETVIERLLMLSLNGTVIRRADFPVLVEHLATRDIGLSLAWNFIRNNWELMSSRYSSDERQLGAILYSVCKHFTTQEQLQKVELFFEEYPEGGTGKRSSLQVLETVRANIRWRNFFASTVLNWVKEYQYMPWKNLRLPAHVVPIHYDLQIQPFLDSHTFQGQVDIQVELLKPVKSVHVHARSLNITSAFMTDESTKMMVPLSSMFFHEPNEFYVMQLGNTADVGTYSLHYEFKGVLSRDLRGFYLSSYPVGANETRYLATTQFEPTDARKAFPCFDEPRFKATFSIKIIHDPGYIAISNMPVMGKEITTTGLQVTQFQRTVKMTTYLVALIVCDFHNISGNSSNGVEVKVFAREGEIDKAHYALEASLKILTYFEEYFGIKYPLPKLDLIAIPDFSSGAMENWGLITFREARLLYDPETSSTFDLITICRIIAHEIAHMWFGNLVTMEWWDDLWLNEGFASYIQYKGMSYVYPEWEPDALFTMILAGVLEADSVTSSHPIIQHVSNPSEISSLFDVISYAKGSSVLRMLEGFLSKEDFQNGISKYLSKHKFANTITFDLWDELESSSSSGLSVTSIMESWTKQMGFPLVTVERNGKSFNVRQSQFLIDPDTAINRKPTPLKYIWKIPLSYHTSEGKTGLLWLAKPQQSFKIDVSENAWVKFNNNMTGVFFVKYDKKNFLLLEDVLKRDINAFTPGDRGELLVEAFFLARAGHLSYMSALNLSRYIVQENHYVPWAMFSTATSFLHHRLTGTETGKHFKAFVRGLLTEALKGVKFSDTGTQLERLRRATIFKVACRSGEKSCLHVASHAFRSWLNGESLEPNFKSIVFHYGMRQIGDESTWQQVFQKYLQEPSHAEKIKIMTGLGQVQDETILLRYLNYTLDETKIRGQDIGTVYGTVVSNPKGHDLAWNFLKDNWKFIISKFGKHSRTPGRLLRLVCSDFNTPEKMQEIKEFLKEHPETDATKQSRRECLQDVDNNIKWISKFEPKVAESLRGLLS